MEYLYIYVVTKSVCLTVETIKDLRAKLVAKMTRIASKCLWTWISVQLNNLITACIQNYMIPDFIPFRIVGHKNWSI